MVFASGVVNAGEVEAVVAAGCGGVAQCLTKVYPKFAPSAARKLEDDLEKELEKVVGAEQREHFLSRDVGGKMSWEAEFVARGRREEERYSSPDIFQKSVSSSSQDDRRPTSNETVEPPITASSALAHAVTQKGLVFLLTRSHRKGCVDSLTQARNALDQKADVLQVSAESPASTTAKLIAALKTSMVLGEQQHQREEEERVLRRGSATGIGSPEEAVKLAPVGGGDRDAVIIVDGVLPEAEALAPLWRAGANGFSFSFGGGGGLAGGGGTVEEVRVHAEQAVKAVQEVSLRSAFSF